jgi:hypothetical protein
MELKDFIALTMKGITDGIADCEKQGVTIMKDNFNDVVFDVAVTVANTSENGAGGSIKVAGIGIGGNMKQEETNRIVSRINFHITHKPV